MHTAITQKAITCGSVAFGLVMCNLGNESEQVPSSPLHLPNQLYFTLQGIPLSLQGFPALLLSQLMELTLERFGWKGSSGDISVLSLGLGDQWLILQGVQ